MIAGPGKRQCIGPHSTRGGLAIPHLVVLSFETFYLERLVLRRRLESIESSGSAHGRSYRHADEGRHPRLCRPQQEKSWMPTFVGMTDRAWLVRRLPQQLR